MKWLVSLMIMGAAMSAQAAEQKAIFAGGCFWCIEAELQELHGVSAVVSGYTGGTVPNPTYEMVSKGGTGHFEAVEVTFDPQVIEYAKLLDVFWGNIDPTDDGGQFFDRGSHYKTAIFYANEEQKLFAEASKMKAQAMLEKPIVTEILPAKPFFAAESYHQDYYKTSPLRYNAYKQGSRREGTLDQIWGDAREQLKKLEK